MSTEFMQDRANQFNEMGGIHGIAFYGITLGRVVSTDDPQQMGRLFVLCPDLGDPPDLSPEDFTSLPPCTYMAPFAGITESQQARGSEDTYTTGPLTYGMWAIPKRGAIVGVMCINGNTNQRVWVGSIYEQFATNTLPHGRFFMEDAGGQVPHPEGAPYGPLSATEQPIQPIFDNQTQAFKTRKGNFEWRTRGSDFQTTGIYGEDNFSLAPCNIEDDSEVEFKQEDGTVITVTQGMDKGRDNEGVNDNQTYSWTTPGFHSISMDDRQINCRIKLRTTSGHQIIMDDTNERIYISTCKGNNWIEIDEDGTIDIYSSEKISATAKHINFTAEETIRLYGKKGVHIKSDEEIRIQSGSNVHMTVAYNIDVKAGGNIRDTCLGTREVNAGVSISETSPKIHRNNPTPAALAVPTQAFFTNRYPQHEPWARTSTKFDFTHDPKYKYTDQEVGREHKTRGTNWRR